MSTPGTTEAPVKDAKAGVRFADMYQVVLHNDDENSMEHVVGCLMQVFGHSQELAVRIMLEAHHTGQAIAEVEAEDPARLHRDQLESFGLTATVERV